MNGKNTVIACLVALTLIITGSFGGVPILADDFVREDEVDEMYAEQIAEIEKVHGEPIGIGYGDMFCTTKWRQYSDGFAYVYGSMFGGASIDPGWDISRITDVYLEDGISSIGYPAFEWATLESIRIPDSLKGIGKRTFEGCKIKSLSIPKVAYIGDKAFAGAQLDEFVMSEELKELGYGAFMNSNIKEIVIPKGVTVIEYNTFSGCKELQKVQLEGDVEWIGNNAFANCVALSDFDIPDTVTYLGTGIFEGCTALKSIDIPDKVTYIGKRAFADSGIESINMPDTVEGIGSQAFYRCSNLGSIQLPSALKEIGKEAFCECSRLEGSTVIPDGVEFIEKSTFYNCSSMEGIEIPNSVIKIDDGAFYGCSSLTELYIPESVRTIGDEAFFGTSGIQTLTLSEGVVRIDRAAFEGCGAIRIDVPASVEGIGDSAFAGAAAQNITLPENLKQLGKNVCIGCSRLTEIEIPKNITELGSDSFMDCVSLEAVTLPDSLKKIGDNAFKNCISLKVIQIPDSVESIGSKSFTCCNSLANVNLPKQLQDLGDAFFECDGLTEIVIPGTIKAINNSAFWGCDSLKKIVFEEGVEGVSENTFRYCHSLESITIPSTMKYIPNDLLKKTAEYKENWWKEGFHTIGDGYLYAYGGVEDTVVIPDSVKSIGEYAFKNSNMKELVIPDSVTTICDTAFEDCSRLENIQFGKNVTDISAAMLADTKFFKNKKEESPLVVVNNILLDGTGCTGEAVIPEGVTSIASEAFKDSKITSVQIPDTVNRIGSFAFGDCDSLENLQMGDGVEYISSYAFSGCDSLHDLQIGAGVWYIGEKAFEACGVSEIHIPSNVKVIEAYAFENCKPRKIVVEPGVTTIGDGAFYCYPNYDLEEISLPDTITSLGSHLYCAHQSLNNGETVLLSSNHILTGVWNGHGDVVIPDTITFIGSRILGDREDLYSVTIPSSVTYIEEEAFENCRSDLIVYAQEGSYGANFAKEHNMLYVSWDEKLNGADRGEINSYGSCGDNVNWILYRSGLLYIYGTGTMDEVRGRMPWDGEFIQHVLVQEGVTSICANAWKDSEFLVGVDLPSSVTSIGNNALANLRKDVCIYSYAGSQAQQIAKQEGYLFADKTTDEKVFDASLYGSITDEGQCGDKAYYRIHGNLGVFIFGEGEIWDCISEELKGDSFSDADSGKFYRPWGLRDKEGVSYDDMSSVYIHDGITGVGDNAFDGIEFLRMPDSLKTIGDYAFYHCNVDTIDWPKGSVSLGTHSFSGCTVKELTIPASFEDYGGGAFVGSSIDKVVLEEGFTTVENSMFAQCSYLGEIVLPETITIIDDYAFSQSQFEEIQLPSGLKEIGQNAFDFNRELKQIEIPEGVEYIGTFAFYCCPQLEKINFPSSLQQMGKFVLDDTKWLANQTYTDGMLIADNVLLGVEPCSGEFQIPEGVRVIAGRAFAGSDITSVTIPESVVGIGNSAFEGCYLLEDIQIPSTVVDIHGMALDDTPWYRNKVEKEGLVIVNNILLGGDVKLNSPLIIPEGVVKVAENAFENESDYCKNIFIPASVTSIERYAFNRMRTLDKVTIYGNPLVKNGAFFKTTGQIVGLSNSYAEKYAKERGIAFEVLDVNNNPYPETEGEQSLAKGDLDGDSLVTLTDAQMALKAALRIITLTKVQQKAADVNGDNQITLTDAQLILRKALRIGEF